jgi:hypothetical protein
MRKYKLKRHIDWKLDEYRKSFITSDARQTGKIALFTVILLSISFTSMAAIWQVSVNYSSGDFWEDFLTVIAVMSCLVLITNFFHLYERPGMFWYYWHWFITVVLPVLNVIYFIFAPDPMWFLSPREVGWGHTLLNGFGFFLMLASIWGTFIAYIRNLDTVINWLFMLLYLATMIIIFRAAYMELTIIGLLLFFGSAGGSGSAAGGEKPQKEIIFDSDGVNQVRGSGSILYNSDGDTLYQCYDGTYKTSDGKKHYRKNYINDRYSQLDELDY